MDRKHVQAYGMEILSYRLRTARQKKRMQYEDFDKRLIQLDREEDELSRRQKSLGWEPLIPPVQKGWKRFFVLREDVAQSKQAEFFEGILRKINTYHWSHQKNFKIKKRRLGQKYYVVKPQKLKELCPPQFKSCAFTESEQKYFDVEFRYHHHRWTPSVVYVFNEPWRFVLQVRPNMIEKVKVIDPMLESRKQWIKDYRERGGRRGRFTKIVWGGAYGHRWWEDPRERNPLKNKPLQRILDEIRLEN
jgi:hypothetical protein